jgi:hypothetical protein
MSAEFAAASSQSITTLNPPVTAMPFTVGMWIMPLTTVNGVFWMLCQASGASSSTNNFRIQQITSAIRVSANGDSLNISGTLTVGTWSFVVVRFISATNRYGAHLFTEGNIAHAQRTTSITPTSLDKMGFGGLINAAPGTYLSGRVGEFWITNTDIQPDGGQLDDNLMRQLAYGGPFSVPHVAAAIQEYRPFRAALTTDKETGDEYYRPAGQATWTNNNGVLLAPHPPLPGTYADMKIIRPLGII